MKFKKNNLYTLITNVRLFFIPLGFFIALHSCKVKQNAEIKEEVNYIPYYLEVYKADSLYLTKNYEQSFNILDKIFKEYVPLNFGIYEEYETYIKLSHQLNKKTNPKLISKLVSKYGKRIDEIEQDSILSLVYKNSKLDENQYQKLRAEYLASLNMSLRDTILRIYERDQNARTKKETSSNIEKTDLYNQHKLVEIINKYGFPSVQKIGIKSLEQDKYDPIDITEVWIHMMDYNGEEKNYITQQIKKAVKDGKCNPLILSLILDRESRIMKRAKSEYYYGLTTYNVNLSKNELLEVNERRKQIGLPTFEFEKWKMKIYWGN